MKAFPQGSVRLSGNRIAPKCFPPNQFHSCDSNAIHCRYGEFPLSVLNHFASFRDVFQTVLVVEGEENLLEILQNNLEQEGYQVYPATDGGRN